MPLGRSTYSPSEKPLRRLIDGRWSSWRQTSRDLRAGQAHEGGVDVGRAGLGDDARHLAMREHPALVQHHEIVAWQ